LFSLLLNWGKLRVIKNVCVFASASNALEEKFYEEARQLGLILGKVGFNIVYGGSNRGMMWQCASKVKECGGKVFGVMPEKLNDFGTSDAICDEFFLTKCMRTRKAKLDELSDAFITLAGGFGTVEELSEMIVQKQLGYTNRPLVILNSFGFYDKLIDFFEEIISQNFAKENSRNNYFVADTPQSAVEYLLNYKFEDKVITKSDIYV